MKYKKYILFFFLIIFCFSNCKKYPEGPEFSLSSKKSRIKGIWSFESFFVNGVDSSIIYCNSSISSCPGYEIGQNGHSVYKIGHEGDTGKWEFSNNQKNIVIYNTSGSGEPPLFVDYKIEWEIQRLTQKQFWLKRNFNNKEYYFKLKAN